MNEEKLQKKLQEVIEFFKIYIEKNTDLKIFTFKEIKKFNNENNKKDLQYIEELENEFIYEIGEERFKEILSVKERYFKKD